jgi:hypothetical protein
MWPMKKKSVLTLICISFLSIYFLWSTGQHLFLAFINYDHRLVERKQTLLDTMNLGYSLLKGDLTNDLKNRFSDLQAKGDIDFFILNDPKTGGFWASRNKEFPNIEIAPGDFQRMIETTDSVYAAIKIKNYILTAGFRKTENWAYLANHIKRNKNYFISDLAMVVFLIITILAYFLKDIFSILSIFQSNKKRRFDGVASRSAESDLFIRGLSGYENSLDELSAENQSLNNQILSALKSELKSGRTPPYEFDCTLVRTDINDFSSIFAKFPVETFMTTINEFFEEVTHTVSRYDGYIYEFVGDEVIYYFKDDEVTNSAIIALSAVRDINEIALRINQKSNSEHGYPFIVKSSLANGKLRFGRQVNNYSLAGSILIETVRLLNHIPDKKENSVVYDENVAQKVLPIVESISGPSVLLKGVQKERHLHFYNHHQNLQLLLESDAKSDVKQLSFYRDNESLVLILNYLNKGITTLKRGKFLAITEILKTFRVSNTSPELKQAYTILLKSLVAENKLTSAPEVPSNHYLSSIAIMAIHLLDLNQFKGEIQEIFQGLLKSPEKRVVANALDVISHFDRDDQKVLFHPFLREKNNRVLANAIVKEGRKTISRPVVRKLKQMLDSDDPYLISSALYALGEIASFHKNNNRVYYNTHLALQKLVERIDSFASNENEMVQRQQKLALTKINRIEFKAKAS